MCPLFVHFGNLENHQKSTFVKYQKMYGENLAGSCRCSTGWWRDDVLTLGEVQGSGLQIWTSQNHCKTLKDRRSGLMGSTASGMATGKTLSNTNCTKSHRCSRKTGACDWVFVPGVALSMANRAVHAVMGPLQAEVLQRHSSVHGCKTDRPGGASYRRHSCCTSGFGSLASQTRGFLCVSPSVLHFLVSNGNGSFPPMVYCGSGRVPAACRLLSARVRLVLLALAAPSQLVCYVSALISLLSAVCCRLCQQLVHYVGLLWESCL